MMKRIIAMAAILMAILPSWGQETALSAFFNYATFYQPESQRPYVETYLSVDAWSLQFKETKEGKYQATVEVVLIVRQGDSVVYGKKYNLMSPAIADRDATNFNFIDLQRFSLDNGLYDMELRLRDIASDDSGATVRQKVNVVYDRKKPSLSSLQLMAKATKTSSENMFSRNGYDMEPYVSDFVPEHINQLNVYYEIYNIEREVHSKEYLSYLYVENSETGQRAGNIQRVIRHTEAKPIVPQYASIDISELPSGNYNLVVEVHNRNNDLLLYRKLPFYRAAKFTAPTVDETTLATSFASKLNNENDLRYYLDALYPIASDDEKDAIKEIIRRPGLEEKQMFLYKFWVSRDPLKAEQLWREYKERLDYVDKNFSYPKTRGYRTDRGRVYLQYGAPDFIRDEKNFVGALQLGSGVTVNSRMKATGSESLGHIYYLPYQLWRYNKLDNDDQNRVFLFWDEMRSGYYQLLVSNARGETWDPLWERRLSQQQLDDYVEGEVGQQFKRGY